MICADLIEAARMVTGHKRSRFAEEQKQLVVSS